MQLTDLEETLRQGLKQLADQAAKQPGSDGIQAYFVESILPEEKYRLVDEFRAARKDSTSLETLNNALRMGGF